MCIIMYMYMLVISEFDFKLLVDGLKHSAEWKQTLSDLHNGVLK